MGANIRVKSSGNVQSNVIYQLSSILESDGTLRIVRDYNWGRNSVQLVNQLFLENYSDLKGRI